MGKEWKAEFWVITLCVVMAVCALIPRLIEYRKDDTEVYHDYQFHLMMDDVIYWKSDPALSYVTNLPEDAVRFAEVETTTDNLAGENGQANGFAAGTSLYRSEARPGLIYAKDENDRWNRLVVKELQQYLLRYDGKLYIYVRSSIPSRDLNFSYRFLAKEYAPSGEKVSYGQTDCVPVVDNTVNVRWYDGYRIYLNPEQANMVALVEERMKDGKPDHQYYPFIEVESIGLDYSPYEWE